MRVKIFIFLNLTYLHKYDDFPSSIHFPANIVYFMQANRKHNSITIHHAAYSLEVIKLWLGWGRRLCGSVVCCTIISPSVWIPGTCLSGSLTKIMNSRFSERICPKEREEHYRERHTAWISGVDIYMHRHR